MTMRTIRHPVGQQPLNPWAFSIDRTMNVREDVMVVQRLLRENGIRVDRAPHPSIGLTQGRPPLPAVTGTCDRNTILHIMAFQRQVLGQQAARQLLAAEEFGVVLPGSQTLYAMNGQSGGDYGVVVPPSPPSPRRSGPRYYWHETDWRFLESANVVSDDPRAVGRPPQLRPGLGPVASGGALYAQQLLSNNRLVMNYVAVGVAASLGMEGGVSVSPSSDSTSAWGLPPFPGGGGPIYARNRRSLARNNFGGLCYLISRSAALGFGADITGVLFGVLPLFSLFFGVVGAIFDCKGCGYLWSTSLGIQAAAADTVQVGFITVSG
jgi:hypothetical protein